MSDVVNTTRLATPVHGQNELAVDKLKRFMQRFIEPEQVVELRAVDVETRYGKPYVAAGFFDADHLHQFALAALKITESARGVYFTLNPLNPDLLARKCNRIERATEGALAKDADVLKRCWLFIDADPVRDPLISASDAEKAAAYGTICQVRAYLTAKGWPLPILSDSGNGYHLLYRIDLPVDDGGLVQSMLQKLAAKFDSAQVKIDQSVFNPARLCKVPYTMARKGDSIPSRPHRQAQILEVPGP